MYAIISRLKSIFYLQLMPQNTLKTNPLSLEIYLASKSRYSSKLHLYDKNKIYTYTLYKNAIEKRSMLKQDI